MLVESLVCITQITVVSVFAYSLALMMNANPRSSARLCWLGIVISTCLFVVTILSIPVQEPIHRVGMIFKNFTRTNHTKSTTGDFALEHEKTHPPSALSYDIPGIPLQTLLDQVARFSRTRRVDDRRIAFLWWIVVPALLIVLLARVACGLFASWQIARSGQPLKCAPTETRLKELVKVTSISECPRIRKSPLVDSPCVTWITGNEIFVPMDFASWTERERDIALVHELAHLERRDARYRTSAGLCATILFFHPLLTLLYRRLVFSQEIAADLRGAAIIGNVVEYRKGLSSLALRLDAERWRALGFGVSVSSHHVIRRIKMLGSIDRRGAERRGWCELCSMLFVCALGVSAVSWADEDEPIRVASRSAENVSPDQRSSFSRPAGEPWKILGESSGYSMFRVGEMSQHEAFKSDFASIQKDVLRKAVDPAIGLSLANIKMVQTNAVMSINQIPKEKRKGPQTQSLNLGANAFDVSCSVDVDWAKAIDEIYIPAFGPEESEATQWIVKKMKETGTSNSFILKSKKENSRPSTLQNDKVKQLWKFVDGGTLAIAITIPENVDESWAADEKDPYQALPWCKAVQTVAIGIDLFASKSGRPKIRLALAPNDDQNAGEIAKMLETTKSLLLASESATIEKMDAEKRSKLQTIFDDVRQWTISVQDSQGSDGKPFVTLDGDLTNLPLFLF